jgi:hypothetical protein
VIFSKADVIRRVNADFVPVALKAGLVDYPPDNNEGRLYREIARSRILPQGICVVNSAGKVLDWVFMFDDDKSVLAFLDHARKRFAAFRNAKQPFPAERYMKFPSQKLADIEDNGKVVPIAERHAEGESCPGKPRIRQGTIIARVFGRALDKDGEPAADTVRQENYVEDRFTVPLAKQEALAKALATAGAERFKIADDLSRLIVSHAFMGELDVNPSGGINGSKGRCTDCTFWGQKVRTDSNGRVQVHIDGKSEVAGVAGDGQKGEGPPWQHQVKLAWQGFVEMNGNGITQLLLVARGTEKLKRRNKNEESNQGPGGHAIFIDLDCGVRYGIIGEPVPAEEASSADEANAPAAAAEPAGRIPDQARKQLVEVLGGAFVVYRDRVWEELKLSEEQKEKLLEKFPDHVRATVKVFEKIKDLKPAEREKEMDEHRRQSDHELSALLKDVLDAKQQERLFQLQLQQAGAFALLGQHEAFLKLEITDEQRKQMMDVVRQMQNKIEALTKEVQSGGKPETIRAEALKIHKQHESRIEALLTDAQKRQWQDMLGKPLDLSD